MIYNVAQRINNCVGERNQKYFIQFLVYVGILAVYALGLVITSWILECSQCSNDIAVKQSRMYVYFTYSSIILNCIEHVYLSERKKKRKVVMIPIAT